jgi:hypothetical protein
MSNRKKEARKIVADENAKKREALTDEQQLERIKNRPGNSKNERRRLEQRIATRKANEKKGK